MGTFTLTGPGASVDRSQNNGLSFTWGKVTGNEYLHAWRLQYRVVGSGTWLNAVIPTATNLLPNPSVETNLNGWTLVGSAYAGYDAPLARVSGGRRDSWRAVATVAIFDDGNPTSDRQMSVVVGGVYNSPTTYTVPVTPGARYNFSAWTLPDGNQTATHSNNVSIRWMDANNNVLSPLYSHPLGNLGGAGVWTPIVGENVAPPGAAFALLTASGWTSPYVGGQVGFDDFCFQRVDNSSNTVAADGTGGLWTYKYAGAPAGFEAGAPPVAQMVLGPNFLAAGNYEFRIEALTSGATWAPYQALLSYSNTVTSTMVTAPAAPTITAPASGATVVQSPSNATMTYTAGPTQVQWRVMSGATVEYDSGALTVLNTSTSHTLGLPYPVNGSSRTVQARTATSSIWSSWASRDVTVAYTVPALPTFTAAGEDTYGLGFNHAARFTVTNPTPTGTQPTVTSYLVEWRQIGTTAWKVAGTQTAGQPLVWYAAPSLPMEARVTAYGANGTTRTTTAQTITPAVQVKGVCLYNPGEPAGVKAYRLNDDGAEDDEAVESALLTFSGRQYPVLEFGAGTSRQITVPLLTLRQDVDIASLKAFLRGRTPIIYCDRRGRAVLARMTVDKVKDEFYGYTTALTFDVLDSWGA